ncbi:FG-GAP-like repeat-containing protein, partial [Winogradskyella sp.]|nr:FG-GAP-like repeat-containing protein [Winogradskyella sp.]
MPDQSITYLASANLSANNYIIWKTGATFSGWNTAPDGSGTAYGNGQSFTMSAATNVTLYARWISVGGGGTQLFVRLLNTIKNSNSSTLNTVTMTLDADLSTSIEQFKQNITEFTNVLPENQILVFNNKILENGRTLADYDIQNESLLKMVAVNLYPSSYLLAGGNTTLNTVMPDGTLYSNATVTTTPNFMGTLSIDVDSGEVTIQNASPAGTYLIQVEKNYVNENNVSLGVQRQTFNLTVYDSPIVQENFNAPVNTGLVVSGIKTQSGNFNNDNVLDIITLTENELVCGLGNGQGGFVNTITSFNLFNPTGIEVLDINNDGVNDVIIVGVHNSLVFIGNNSGGFTQVNQLTLNNPNTFTSSDFNNDGYIDFAVNSYAVVNHYLGDGTGSFTFTSSFNLSATPSAIYYNDVNNDGNVDVLVANKNMVTTFLTPSDKGTVSVRLGDGVGNFTTGYEIPVDYKPTALVIDDFNGDGFKDFASTSEVNGNVSIKFGDGTGDFTGNTQVIVGDNPSSIVLGNFNGDCFPDLALANTASNTVSIRYGDNLGNFSGTTNIAVGAFPQGLIKGDFNNDGLQDLFIENADSSLSSILMNNSLLPMPVIDSVSPPNGVSGDTVTISGTQFELSPTVTLGGVSMTVISATSTSIDVVLPSGINGGDIFVSNSCGPSSLGSPYVYGTTTYTYNNGWLP